MLRLKPLLKQLTIQTKGLELRKFDLDYRDPTDGDLGWAQRRFVAEIERQYNAGRPVRIIVLKARQLGISTATEGVLYNWSFLHPGSNGLVVAHETDSSMELFEKTKLYWDDWPFKSYYHLKYSTKQHMHWEETRSKLRIATAKNVRTGRGTTFHAVHLSECAFYFDASTFMLGLQQTIPRKHGTIVVVESTANGMGNWFHENWLASEAGMSDYIPLFFPWWQHPEYRQQTTLTVRSELNIDERRLLKMGASMEHIAWRRWAIYNLANGDLSFFMQEYPATPEEAFITTGRTIFSSSHLRDCYIQCPAARGRLIDDERAPNGVRWVPDPLNGPLVIFKRPKRGDLRSDRYFVAGDPSETVAGDPACIQVINRQTFEQVAVWHGRISPMFFGEEMIRVGRFYNNAMLCPEIEGGGQATIALIIARGYPNIWLDKRADHVKSSMNVYGWATNYQRKMWAIGTLQRLIVDLSLKLHDRQTYNQLLLYVQREDGSLGNPDSKIHDDAVMSLAIAVTASIAEGPFIEDMIPADLVQMYNDQQERELRESMVS